MKKNKSYIIQSFVILVMASGFFLFFKSNLPSKIFSESPIKTGNVVIDSLLLEAFADAQEKVDSLPVVVKDKEQKQLADSLSSDGQVVVVSEETLLSQEDESTYKGMLYLEPFFAKLYTLEKEKGKQVRIAYYGDSMTDGDLIVQDLRKNFQDNFGGSGVGFIPINVESAKSRGSVKHRYSSNWRVQSFLNVKRPIRPFGVSGQVFFVKDTVRETWVSLQAGGIRHMTTLNSPTLYYGSSNNKKGKVQVIIGKDTIVKNLSANSELNKLQLYGGSLYSLKVQFKSADSIPIYGIDVSSRTGVQVDNFSSRGNSGLPLSLFRVSLMNRFQNNLGYNLIILHYGTNVLNYGSLDYRWYTKQMGRVVNHLKTCFPNATILVISTADKSTKYEMEMKTDKAVSPLVKAQRKYAIETQSGFFNLYDAMGGSGSMIKWVQETPIRANKDYTHFNFRGAQEVANLIYKHLDEGYKAYKLKHGLPAVGEVAEELEKTVGQSEQQKDSTKVVDTVEK
ncbi:hypothetical protein VSO92_03100 [Myroides pelagicus]|nr:hypothetical protein [Myroides pelagicus]MEC4113094.1 hypothetical protein [Myroides pelagicus]